MTSSFPFHDKITGPVEVRSRTRPVEKPLYTDSRDCAHHSHHRHTPNGVVATISHHQVLLRVQRKDTWAVEARVCPLSICKPYLPVVSKRVDGTLWCYNEDRVVLRICNEHVDIGGHHHVVRVIEVCVRLRPICETFLDTIVLRIIFLPDVRQCTDDDSLLCH